MVAVSPEERENSTKGGRSMHTPPENQDWFLPAVLVAIAGSLVLIAGIAYGVQSNAVDADSAAGKLEQWTSCLGSNGANVPQVETLHDGGFRVTVDGSLVDEGINWETLGPALDACEDQAPEEMRSMMGLIEGFVEFPHAEFEMFEFGEIDEANVEHEFRNFSEICERIERGEIDPAEVSRRLRRACRQTED
jgi:hypothetical protein